MAANAWLAKLGVSPEAACRCGHNAHVHLHGKSCGALVDEAKFKYCKCEIFREANSEQENEMANEKKVRKPKSEGRTSRLAGMVDSPLTIFMKTGGKEYKGVVLTSGVIKIDEKEFTSPSSAGSYILGKDEKGKPKQVDGWKSWYFNRDGERVMLNTLRGSKSPLKIEESKPKRAKKAKSAKANGAPKAKRARKPRRAVVAKSSPSEAPSAAPEAAVA